MVQAVKKEIGRMEGRKEGERKESKVGRVEEAVKRSSLEGRRKVSVFRLSMER